MEHSVSQLQQIFDQAEQLYSLAEIDEALEQLATALTAQYAGMNPLILCVMTGSIVTAGHLIPKLPFLFELDYIHMSRYGHALQGGH